MVDLKKNVLLVSFSTCNTHIYIARKSSLIHDRCLARLELITNSAKHVFKCSWSPLQFDIHGTDIPLNKPMQVAGRIWIKVN